MSHLNVTEHNTKEVCPRCEREYLNHVHCGNSGCSRYLVVCSVCDKRQAVEAFMRDHLANCAHTLNIFSEIAHRFKLSA